MNITTSKPVRGPTLVAASIAAILLAACATAPVKPAGSADARAKLTQLESDPNLSTRAPAAIKDADVAVTAAEQPELDAALGAHRVFIAERKVDIAIAQAQTRYSEDQRAGLESQRQNARLDERTREADVAKGQVAAARADSALQKSEADQARTDADAARMAAADSDRQAADLQQQIDALQAKVTDRGLVVTLGDVLFTTGKADLRAGTSTHLDKLVSFLNHYPLRTVRIEGFTDSVGSEAYNQDLSLRRADSVRAYLARQGIDGSRLSSAGRGESDPVGDNGSANGRQQNRRVEVVISNPAVASR